ncbi:hypothetical protein [uncultured Bifidobacterium sp.]|uniref:hypothetical protein n=1 Tax=uncultured Bifidobacterium sp. TaxID=165187 RepID=UPI0025EF994D|nr:hypothetical protein [uncultured Bifidobacterium sp.]
MRQKKWTIPALIAGAVLFCIIPYAYQWITGNNADWQAWWAFGTFLIALIAALIAYQEYNDHVMATEPLVVVRVAKQEGSTLDSVFLTNAGGSIATDIKFTLKPGITLGDGVTKEYMSKSLPLLKPDEDTMIIDGMTISAAHILTGTNRTRQTLHVEWEDASGRQYANDNNKLDFGLPLAGATGEK